MGSKRQSLKENVGEKTLYKEAKGNSEFARDASKIDLQGAVTGVLENLSRIPLPRFLIRTTVHFWNAKHVVGVSFAQGTHGGISRRKTAIRMLIGD